MACRLNNAASGGFSGYTFPHAPRAIKDHKNIKKPDGYPFDPSERPLLQFKGNTAHSTGKLRSYVGAVHGMSLRYLSQMVLGAVRINLRSVPQ